MTELNVQINNLSITIYDYNEYYNIGDEIYYLDLYDDIYLFDNYMFLEYKNIKFKKYKNKFVTVIDYLNLDFE